MEQGNVGAHVRPLSSTRMGRRPCSSASMSLGLHWWKAPLQMNRMWSVLTLPYLVLTCRVTRSNEVTNRLKCPLHSLSFFETILRTLKSCSAHRPRDGTSDAQ